MPESDTICFERRSSTNTTAELYQHAFWWIIGGVIDAAETITMAGVPTNPMRLAFRPFFLQLLSFRSYFYQIDVKTSRWFCLSGARATRAKAAIAGYIGAESRCEARDSREAEGRAIGDVTKYIVRIISNYFALFMSDPPVFDSARGHLWQTATEQSAAQAVIEGALRVTELQ